MLLAIGHIFELFGGEGLLRPAMHYRWNFDDQNLDFLNSEFSLLVPPGGHDEGAFAHNSGRMRKAAVNFGVTPDSVPLIEAAFEEWLDLFSAHLEHHPYLLIKRFVISTVQVGNHRTHTRHQALTTEKGHGTR